MPALHTSSTPPHTPNAAAYIVYVGTYSNGIYAFRFHTASGKLEALGMQGELKNPSFVVTDPAQKRLYAVSELEGNAEGAVAGFDIDRSTAKLTKLNSESSAGVAPCHLAIDASGRVAIVANYTSGSVAAFPIGRDGVLGAPMSVMKAQGSSVNHERQEGPHAHQVIISPDGKKVYTPDLGLDEIRIYSLDSGSGKLTEKTPLKVEAGLGPRHMVFSAGGQFAYIINELKTVVTVYKHAGGDKFELVQTVNSLPGDQHADGAAEILMDGAGRFLYTSNRDVTNHSIGSVSVFAVDHGSGKLTQIQHVETAGRMPRGVEFDPSEKFLLVGDQKKNVIQVFQIGGDGKLTDKKAQYEVPSPVSFAFVPAV